MIWEIKVIGKSGMGSRRHGNDDSVSGIVWIRMEGIGEFGKG